ncbi:MAG: dihydrolipoyllysine-residue acetyltransferase [Gammaproteobacteria bacterium]|nr:dihydrolipoyllysine-residue acetyltransferase [Gammaproteobacteria bacterium]MCD8543116.1 dihydrolipoyllysine-residue acetyltransferase [Gammaproteobacteria bacterium]
MSLKEILVPDLGGADHVDVIELNVKLGDIVALDQGIVTLESDKATMEVPATFAGKIKEICVNVGDKLSEGQCVAIVEITTSEIVEKSIGSLQILDVTVPDLGGADSVDVIEINVKVGDVVAIDQGLITLESDKATMEVPATSAGTIKEIFVNIGDKLSEGQKVVAIETQEMINKETISSNVLSKNAPSQTNPLSITPTIQGTINPSQDVQQLTKIAEASAINPHYHATPMVRRLASEFGVDLSRVTATGPKGRILKDDIQLYVKQQLVRAQNGGNVGLTLPEMPVVDFSKFGDTETQALSKIKKLTGTNLRRNWLAIPHVTQCDEADITELESYRKGQKSDADARGLKLTPLVFIMKAVVGALKEFPRFNASLSPDSQSLIIKKYFHIGVAVDTPDGLVVPVVRDVDQKDIYTLAKELGDISEKARQGKLLPKDMQGGCFTISSLGGIGGTAFTPIVNAPEVGILGVSKAQMKPVYQNNQFVPRLMLPLSLSYDHRVIDGAEGARFIVFLSQLLSDVEKLIL